MNLDHGMKSERRKPNEKVSAVCFYPGIKVHPLIVLPLLAATVVEIRRRRQKLRELRTPRARHLHRARVLPVEEDVRVEPVAVLRAVEPDRGALDVERELHRV